MDELVIDDKKYISSKRAAKLTGYAKDYVGQLCREGRVTARLVGRSWYVLESAIQDHRFGNEAVKDDSHATHIAANNRPSTWERPRYEADAREVQTPSHSKINVIEENELQQSEEQPVQKYHASNIQPENMSDAWEAWFNRVETVSPRREEIAEEQIIEEPIEEEPYVQPEPQPIHISVNTSHMERHPEPTVRQFDYQDQDEPTDEVQIAPPPRTAGRSMWRPLVRATVVLGVCVAVLAATAAVTGSGYLDDYATSLSRVPLISGVGLYNK